MTLTGIADPYALAAQEDRCSRRYSVKIEAGLRPSGDKGFPVVVRDISIAGFSCEAVTGMHVGNLCWLTLPGLSGQQAEVVWNTGHMVGCAFASLLSPPVLEDVVERTRR